MPNCPTQERAVRRAVDEAVGSTTHSRGVRGSGPGGATEVVAIAGKRPDTFGIQPTVSADGGVGDRRAVRARRLGCRDGKSVVDHGVGAVRGVGRRRRRRCVWMSSELVLNAAHLVPPPQPAVEIDGALGQVNPNPLPDHTPAELPGGVPTVPEGVEGTGVPPVREGCGGRVQRVPRGTVGLYRDCRRSRWTSWPGASGNQARIAPKSTEIDKPTSGRCPAAPCRWRVHH